MKMRRNLKKLLSVLLVVTFATSFLATIPVWAEPVESSVEAELREFGRQIIESEDKDPFAFRGQETRKLFRGTTFPESYDLRNADLNGDGVGDRNCVTSVKFQNPFGTCWGFAAIAASESSILSSGLATDADSLNLSEKHLTFFTRRPIDEVSDPQYGEGYIFRGSDGSSDIYGEGNFFYATSLFSSGMGPVQESVNPLFEYHGENLITAGSWYSASDDWWIYDSSLRWKQSYVLSESYMLPSPSHYLILESPVNYNKAMEAIKEQIKAGRGVSISFCADNSRPNDGMRSNYINHSNWAHYTYEPEAANHGVTIIGWDDNYPKENFAHKKNNGTDDAPIPKNDGAWLAKNSWGSMEESFPNRNAWGLLEGQDKGVYNSETGKWEYNSEEGAVNTGYFWISYEDKSIDLVEALSFDRVNNDDLYMAQYDLMPVSWYNSTFSSGTYKMANIFDVEQVTKGDKGGRLESVSCITTTPGTYVTYDIYVLNDGAASPTDGTKVASLSQTYAYGGFHKKNLATPYLLRKGQKFSVVVTQKTPDDFYIANLQVERNASGAASNSLFYAKGVVNEGESMLYLPNSSTWVDLGRDEVKTSLVGNPAYDIDNFPIKAYISKPTVSDFPDPSITAPTAKTGLVFNKNEQELITAGSVEGGTMEYALADPSGAAGTYSNDIPKATAAKTYRVFYKAIVGGEVVGADSIAVTIGKKPLTVNWTGGDSWKYDKSEHGPVAELEGVIEGTDVSAVVEGNKQTDAGSYIAKVTGLNGADAGNYSLPSSTSTKSYSITKRRITLTSGSATAQYQEGTALTENSVTVSGDGFASKDGVEEGVNWTVTGSRTAPGESPNTFTYTFKSGTRAGNYDITTNFGTLTVNWWSDEQKSEHIVEIESKSKETEYNGRVQTVSGFKDGSETVTVGDETFRVTGLTAEGSGTTVGTYSNIISGTAVIERASGEDVTSHFMIEYKNGILTIKPKDIKDARIALENELKYTGSEQTQEISVRVDGTVLTKGTDYEVSGDKATAAGTHTLTVTGKGNYTGSATKEYSITNPELTGISVTQDGTLSYNGYGQTPKLKTTADQSDVTFTYAESESSTFTSGIPTFKDAKEHTLYYRAEKSGYTPKTGTVTIKIDKITLGVIWEGISFTYDGSSHAPTAKPLGVVGSDSIRYNVSGAASNAGTHTARITGAEGTGVDNYNLPPSSDMECTFRIVKQSSNSTNNGSSSSSNSSKTAANTSSGSSRNSTSKTTANTSSGSSKSTASTSSGNTKTTADTSTGSSKTSTSKTTANTSSGSSKNPASKSTANTSSGNSRTAAAAGTDDADDNGSESKETDKSAKSGSKSSSSKTAKEIAGNTKLEDNESALKAAIGEEKFKELSDSGTTPSIRLNVDPIDKVPDSDKKAIEDAVKDQLSSIPGLVVAEYFDITLEVKEDRDWETISNTQSPVRVVAKIPESLKKKAEKFFMMRLHEGDTTLLEDKDDDPDTITVESDEFSTYALLYQKTDPVEEEKETEAEVSEQETSADENMTAQITDKTPDTGAGNAAVAESDDSSDMWRIWVFAAILLLIAGGVTAAILVPKLKNRE